MSTPYFILGGCLYNANVDEKLKDLLFEKYLEYQKQSGKKVTEKQFSEYIGMGQVYLNQIMNGRRSAGEKTIAHLANFFQDMRFYDAVGLPRPDQLLLYIIRHWGEVPEEVRKKLAEEISPYTSEKVPDDKSV
jgi:transcriptional regulator with XRE-family HTH domain